MESKKIVVLGAVAAGSKVAAKLKRDNPNYDITIYTKDSNVSYSACAMPYFIGGMINNIDELIVRDVEEFKKNGIKIYTKNECISVNPNNNTVTVKDLTSENIFNDNYDILVISTGARAFLPEIEGINSHFIFKLRNLNDAQKIKNKALKSKTVTIVGGGYIGIELIENFRRLGLNVNVIEASQNIMNVFDKDFSKIIQNYIEKKENGHVKFFLNESIEKFEHAEGYFLGTKCKKAGLIKSDFVVVSVGIIPNTEFLKNSGIEFSIKSTIKVDKYMKTNIENIYACGDCADKNFVVTQKPIWIPLGTTANKEGRITAQNIEGENDTFSGITAAAVTKYFDFTMSCTGLNEKTAAEYGYNFVSSFIIKEDKPSFMPNVSDVYFKLIIDKVSHKILGAQALGSENADKSINIVSAAISAGMTVEQLADIDITYAPPISSTIDILITAAWQIIEKLK